jgi:hypothetical protein
MDDHVHYYRNHGDGWLTCICGAIPETVKFRGDEPVVPIEDIKKGLKS